MSEAIQQRNCVHTNYTKQYANGSCDLYFMRKVNNIDKSLVTINVINNEIRQKR